MSMTAYTIHYRYTIDTLYTIDAPYTTVDDLFRQRPFIEGSKVACRVGAHLGKGCPRRYVLVQCAVYGSTSSTVQEGTWHGGGTY
jgi:hypothetical protein